MKLLLVTEYGVLQGNVLNGTLIEAFRHLRPDWQVIDCHGLMRAYHPGGLRPLRLLNLFYIFGMLPLWSAVRRPDAIVSGTTPPLLQVWAAIVGPCFGARLISWLLDYHPEIEARWLERRGWCRSASLLRRLDRIALRRTHMVVGLDDAMAGAVQTRYPQVSVLAHPTWDEATDDIEREVGPATAGDCVRLAYVGNLGAPHDLAVLERLCGEARNARSIRLLTVGCSEEGQRRLAALCARVGCEFTAQPWCARSDVARHIQHFRPHWAVVLLRADYAGLASPSKFMSYLRWGLPLLYIGPPGTNAHRACERFGAGLFLSNRASEVEVAEATRALTDPERLVGFRAGVKRALDHFFAFNAQTMAQLLVDHLSREPHAGARR